MIGMYSKKARMAKPMSWRTWGLIHGGMVLAVIIIFTIGVLFL